MAFWTPVAERPQNARGRRAPSMLVPNDDRDTREPSTAAIRVIVLTGDGISDFQQKAMGVARALQFQA